MIVVMISTIIITSFVIVVSWWGVLYYHYASNVDKMCIFSIAAAICAVVVINILSIIYDNLPGLTCIKDEEQP